VALSSTVSISIRAAHTGTSGLGAVQDQINKTKEYTLADGTTANKADLVYSTNPTIAASSSTTINLATGSLKDSFGASFAFVRVKVLYVANKATTETNTTLTVGDATNPISTFFGGTNPTLKIPGGGTALLVAPLATAYGVTATTADSIKIATGSAVGGTEVEFLVIGASA